MVNGEWRNRGWGLGTGRRRPARRWRAPASPAQFVLELKKALPRISHHGGEGRGYNPAVT